VEKRMDEDLEAANAEKKRVEKLLGLPPGPEYIGTFSVDQATHPDFKDKTAVDWAVEFAVDGILNDSTRVKHQKLDDIARVLKGTPVDVVEKRWDDGTIEHVPTLGAPSEDYISLRQELANQGYSFQLDDGLPEPNDDDDDL